VVEFPLFVEAITFGSPAIGAPALLLGASALLFLPLAASPLFPVSAFPLLAFASASAGGHQTGCGAAGQVILFLNFGGQFP